MNVHLVDGTFELFRAHFGTPPATSPAGREVGATRGLLRSLNSLLRDPSVTHVAVAFDHVIESFRNDLFAGYKTGSGIEEVLLSQFTLAEQATRALGVVVWSMVEFEADDALATAAARFSPHPEVEQIVICSPDKDLAQCVLQDHVVCFDRMRQQLRDEQGVRDRFGVSPQSIPDWLALVGDTADGIPGIPRWGAKSAAAVLGEYGTIDQIPDSETDWKVAVRGAARLAQNLRENRGAAELYRQLAVLRQDVPLDEEVEDLLWRGPDEAALAALLTEIGDRALMDQIAAP